jgi:hypothetical protein
MAKKGNKEVPAPALTIDESAMLPDRAMRETLRHPEHLRALLRQVVPDLAEDFDYPQMKILDREFLLDDWRKREGDLLVEVPFGVGDSTRRALVCVVLEHQSDPVRIMEFRMLLMAVLYWERQWRRWEESPAPRETLYFTPVLPIIFYSGSKPWTAPRPFENLLGEPASFRAFAPKWAPLFWNIQTLTADELLASTEDWIRALAVVRAEDAAQDEFERLYREALEKLKEIPPEAEVRWYDTLRMVISWATTRRPTEERQHLRDICVNSQPKPRRKRAQTMIKTIADSYREEGREEGSLETARDYLLMIGEPKLGKPSRKILHRIEAITDRQRIRRFVSLLVNPSSEDPEVTSWSDLLDLP